MVQKVIATELASNVAKNKATPYIIGGVILVSLGLTYFGIVRPLLCFFKVLDCGRSKSEKQLFELKAFNPQVANVSNTTISHDLAKNLAEQIEEALGYSWNPTTWVDDDEDALFGAIQRAGSVSNMSLVSRYYESMYDESLVGRIVSKTNPEERDKIITIISKFKQ
tara:strand:+ start:13846 stop:14343 length:498 start_codon:yes stop_codon:yes gene_type:complete